jgi:hypothetical protein
LQALGLVFWLLIGLAFSFHSLDSRVESEIVALVARFEDFEADFHEYVFDFLFSFILVPVPLVDAAVTNSDPL